MKYQAVIFDLFETLITEWGHKKYTKNEMCSELGVEREKFDVYWNQKERERYSGEISFADSILFVCEKCGNKIDDLTLSRIIDKRIRTKSLCFEYINPDLYLLLECLKAKGLKLAIISNCSSEEVKVIRQSRIYEYFNQVILSYEIKMQKPDVRIYKKASDLLGVAADECIFIGDGGNNELEGAKLAGMEAIQAKWYTNQLPHKRGNIDGFLTAEEPLEIMQFLEMIGGE